MYSLYVQLQQCRIIYSHLGLRLGWLCGLAGILVAHIYVPNKQYMLGGFHKLIDKEIHKFIDIYTIYCININNALLYYSQAF